MFQSNFTFTIWDGIPVKVRRHFYHMIEIVVRDHPVLFNAQQKVKSFGFEQGFEAECA